MIRTNTSIFRSIAVVITMAVVNLSVPFGALAAFAPKPSDAKAKPSAPAAKPFQSHLLSAKEMKLKRGRTGQCPYLAGQNKWDIVYKGINLMSGNYTTNATDLSFEGGYGIPVNVTRSYSSNNAEEGPFGVGWSLSADVRSTAGGVLKSGRAPVMAVPVNFKERPTGDADLRLANDPVEAVVTSDAGGQEETIQRDVDGVLTTPSWDHNIIDTTYEYVTVGTSTYQVAKSNTVTTIDGTVYKYSKHGSYVGGMTARSGGVSGEPSNVLKIDKATDRQGNQTSYVYSTALATFAKSNGTVQEYKISYIQMPNGHKISFVWGSGMATPANRIIQIKDNDNARLVNYTYTSGNLTGVTTPGGKVTHYGYGSASAPDGWTGDVATGLLTSITDPRGLTEGIDYIMGGVDLKPQSYMVAAPMAMRLVHPNGTSTQLLLNPSYTTFAPYVFEMDAVYPIGISILGLGGGIDSHHVVNEMMTNFSVDGVNGIVTTSVHVYPIDENGSTLSPYILYLTPLQHFYDLFTQNEVGTSHVAPATYGTHPLDPSLPADSRASSNPWVPQSVQTETVYNFMGKPLSVHTVTATNSVTTSDNTVRYAYWGGDKYYQQKAVMDAAKRVVSLTDYYPSTAAAGSKGQTKVVYDAKNGHLPVYSTIPSDWYATVNYGTGGVPSAKFYNSDDSTVYDTEGRCKDMYKIGPDGSYVQTHTDYGTSVPGSWGQAQFVTEAYGTPIARTTNTNHYNAWGKADVVTDADSHQFTTDYDTDGLVKSTSRTDVTPAVPLVTYTYGTSGVENGQVKKIVDNLSGVTQDIGYQSAAGGGLGQVISVSQSGGAADAYSVGYTYDSHGLRSQVMYATPDGTSGWKYKNYVTRGTYENRVTAFSRIAKVNSSGTETGEVLDYNYGLDGRLSNAMFAQTFPGGDTTKSPTSRAVAHYEYDEMGRLQQLAHYWQSWNSAGTLSTEFIFGNACAYNLTKGLKTSSSFYLPTSSHSSTSTLHHTETYGYDASLDYLTSANYGDGLANPVQSWTYDPAGNRSNSGYQYNALNMMTQSPWATYINDAMGTRLSETVGSNTTTYTWDILQRMVARTGVTASTIGNYEYRADGMRTRKTVGTSVSGYTNTLTRYALGMPMEVENLKPDGTVTSLRESIGVRGVDAEETVNGTWSGTSRTLGASTIAYPIYDGHGNRVCTLSRYGSGSWTTDSPRFVDAWGTVRTGALSGDIPMRYCAAIGQLQDDESGLIYMRARYYEPTSGRFVSEDPHYSGNNWYIYAKNNPVKYFDSSGKDEEEDKNATWQKCEYGMMVADMIALIIGACMDAVARPTILAGVAFMAVWFFGESALGGRIGESFGQDLVIGSMLTLVSAGAGTAGFVTSGGVAGSAISLCLGYAAIISLFLTLEAISEGVGP